LTLVVNWWAITGEINTRWKLLHYCSRRCVGEVPVIGKIGNPTQGSLHRHVLFSFLFSVDFLYIDKTFRSTCSQYNSIEEQIYVQHTLLSINEFFLRVRRDRKPELGLYQKKYANAIFRRCATT
jgi:hypothetical protein